MKMRNKAETTIDEQKSIVDELYGIAENVQMTLDEIRDERLTSPMDVFGALRSEGAKSPMTEDEVNQFVEAVRKERKRTE